MGPKILSGVGCAGLGLSLTVLVVSLALPAVTNGRTSWEEAMLGILPGAVCSGVSALALGAGVAWWIVSRRKSDAIPRG